LICRLAASPGNRTTRAAARLVVCALLLRGEVCVAAKQESALPMRVAHEAMERWPNGHIGPRDSAVVWGFEPGILLAGFAALWDATGNKASFDYIRKSIDQFVQPDGSIRTYDLKAYALNNILMGRDLLLLYRVTGDEKYHTAADHLHQQLATQSRTASGGLWHAQATPNLMLLDDQFMVAPFAAEYAVMFHRPEELAGIADQLALIYRHARNPESGLLYHAWDESRSAAWADKTAGTSPSQWARGMGWFMMALADTLPFYPRTDPNRAMLLELFRHTAAAVVAVQDPANQLWYQILDKPDEQENYVESSSVMMLTYALVKGVRLGFLPPRYGKNAERAWSAIKRRFLKVTPAGEFTITGTVTHISMGAGPKDDGSDGYYLHASVVSDDPKGVGAFLLAATEMEIRKRAH
jgi:unsaturated rhamnogalacturonyl hydrolase